MKEHNCNIAQVLTEAALAQPEAIALVSRENGQWQHYSFHTLAARSLQLAGALHAGGLRRGERVMLMVRPSLDFVALTFALLHMGAVLILIDPGMGYRNLKRCIRAVEPEALIGVGRAIIFSRLFPTVFATLKKRIHVGGWLPGSVALDRLPQAAPPPAFTAGQDDLAAVIFTTGSTGPPKGVHYTHGIFHAQLRLIRDYYGIGPGHTDQPGFTLFGLFSTALGAKAVLPDMDPTRPAQVNPHKFVASIMAEQVSYSFGSPAIWQVVSRHCLRLQQQLPLDTVLMAGAPVSGELLADMQAILPSTARIFTPYGATESLPVASIEAREVVGVDGTWEQTRQGRGYCVGRPLPGMDVRIIAVQEGELAHWSQVEELPSGSIGEIVVRGPVVTPGYDHNESETRRAKIASAEGLWHRMGDMGYLDEKGRLWFCGRKGHRVLTTAGPMYSVCCEAIFNEHPLVRRSALVGIGLAPAQTPVLVVELVRQGKTHKLPAALQAELLQLAQASELTKNIRHFLVHPSFPVDIRHNAKIFREQLALWAGRQMPTA
ncbi:MAG: AMP-binding protein [Desulfobulbaceae bacterium]|nr:AMP-binding protein [Desulfobulbaceae bacterium]